MKSNSPSKRVIFTQGGKGGVGKTEVALSLATWLREHKDHPLLLDFDIENTNKSGLQSFYPEAEKINLHQHSSLDEFFRVCQRADTDIVLADMGAGAGEATFNWFNEAFDAAADMDIAFTAIGVTTNDAGSVQSILKWATELRDRVDYVIVLNEMHSPRCGFEYWHQAADAFVTKMRPSVMTMSARVEEFQAEVRNQCVTLAQIIEGDVESDYFRYIKNLVPAKRYQRQLFTGFEEAAAILLPSNPKKGTVS